MTIIATRERPSQAAPVPVPTPAPAPPGPPTGPSGPPWRWVDEEDPPAAAEPRRPGPGWLALFAWAKAAGW